MLSALLRAPGPRFVAVGLSVTGLHLAIFRIASGWAAPEVANLVAFLAATQVNFAISYFWTWSSRRRPGDETLGSLTRRALVFNGSAMLGFAVNTAVLSTAYRVVGLPALESAVTATICSAGVTFLLNSRVVFARRAQPRAAGEQPRQVFPAPLSAPAAAGRVTSV